MRAANADADGTGTQLRVDDVDDDKDDDEEEEAVGDDGEWSQMSAKLRKRQTPIAPQSEFSTA